MFNRWCSVDIKYDRELLLDIFYKNREFEHTYHNVSEGKEQPISLLNPEHFDKPPHPYLVELQDKFNYVRNGYYLVSGGYHPHIDDRRTCVITFTLKNDYNVPLKFYEPDDIVDMTRPFIWNTAVLHGADNSPTERIFYQIEFEDDKTYEFYYEELIEGRLLR
jgi:hypothetical protein